MNTPKLNPAQELVQILRTNATQAFLPAELAIIAAAEWTHEAAAAQTKSNRFDGYAVPLARLYDALQDVQDIGARFDDIKRALFYGDPAARERLALPGTESTCRFLAQLSRFREAGLTESQAIDYIHAVLGKLTEAIELAATLRDVIESKPLNVLNVIEETGDGRWYDAILAPALGWTLYEVDKANERKLSDKRAGRYKEGGFTASAAVVRDTAGEMQAMQKSLL